MNFKLGGDGEDRRQQADGENQLRCKSNSRLRLIKSLPPHHDPRIFPVLRGGIIPQASMQ
jgi:hypothetical protein